LLTINHTERSDIPSALLRVKFTTIPASTLGNPLRARFNPQRIRFDIPLKYGM
jgi:hypothetical protein